MKRFNDEELPDSFSPQEEDEMHQAYFELVGKEEIMNIMHVDLVQIELNQKLLEQATKIAEKSLFWKFRSTKSKLEAIENIYETIADMVGLDETTIEVESDE